MCVTMGGIFEVYHISLFAFVEVCLVFRFGKFTLFFSPLDVGQHQCEYRLEPRLILLKFVFVEGSLLFLSSQLGCRGWCFWVWVWWGFYGGVFPRMRVWCSFYVCVF